MGHTTNKVKSLFLLGSVWVFLGMYFVDAANLDDLLPDTIVFHPDADDSSPDGSAPELSGNGLNAQKSQPAPDQNASSKKPHTLRVVIDQDSPSLAAEPLVSMLSSHTIPEDQIHISDSFISTSSLYLLNCTLLI